MWRKIIHSFDDLLQPIGADRFLDEYYRNAPLFVEPDERSARMAATVDIEALLQETKMWNRRNFKMWLDRKAIPASEYFSNIETEQGGDLRLDQVKYFLGQGASIVFNHVNLVIPALAALASTIEMALLSRVNTNIYYSAGSHQAFDSHYDDHEVFAIQIDGRKQWRVYEGRQDNPVGQPAPRPGLQQLHDEAKGHVLSEHTMTPGALTYIPRGQYHDALAIGGPSLHVTFSAVAMNGLALFSVIERLAMRDSVFRDDLPRSTTPQGRQALERRLAALGGKINEMLNNPFVVKVLLTPSAPMFALKISWRGIWRPQLAGSKKPGRTPDRDGDVLRRLCPPLFMCDFDTEMALQLSYLAEMTICSQ